MSPEKLMKAGAISGVVLAVVSVLVSDMHAVPDLIITLAQGKGNTISLPEGFAFPYQLAGAVGEPILIMSILLFGLGFFGAWKKTGRKSAKTASVIAFFYAITRIFEAIITLNYATAVESARTTGDLNILELPGMLLGIGAAFTGITGGIVLASCIAVYFSHVGIKLGKIGGLIVVTAVATGMVTKTLSLWVWPYALTAAFVILMCAKSVGIAFISNSLYRQASTKPEAK